LLRRFEQRIDHRVPDLGGTEPRRSLDTLLKRAGRQVQAEISSATGDGEEIVLNFGRRLLVAGEQHDQRLDQLRRGQHGMVPDITASISRWSPLLTSVTPARTYRMLAPCRAAASSRVMSSPPNRYALAAVTARNAAHIHRNENGAGWTAGR